MSRDPKLTDMTRQADQALHQSTQMLEQLRGEQEQLMWRGQKLESDLSHILARIDRQSATLIDRFQDLLAILAEVSQTMQDTPLVPPYQNGNAAQSLFSDLAPSQSQINTLFARAVRRGFRGV